MSSLYLWPCATVASILLFFNSDVRVQVFDNIILTGRCRRKEPIHQIPPILASHNCMLQHPNRPPFIWQHEKPIFEARTGDNEIYTEEMINEALEWRNLEVLPVTCHSNGAPEHGPIFPPKERKSSPRHRFSGLSFREGNWDLGGGNFFLFSKFSSRSLRFHDPIWRSHICQMGWWKTTLMFSVVQKGEQFLGSFWEGTFDLSPTSETSMFKNRWGWLVGLREECSQKGHAIFIDSCGCWTDPLLNGGFPFFSPSILGEHTHVLNGMTIRTPGRNSWTQVALTEALKIGPWNHGLLAIWCRWGISLKITNCSIVVSTYRYLYIYIYPPED